MAGAYEQDTRTAQERVFDYGDSIVRVYDREFHVLAMLNSAGGKKRKLKQVFAAWRAGIPGSAIDPATGEGVDKTDGYNNQQAQMIKGWAEIFRSQGWLVTPTQEEIEQADVSSEIAEQKMMDEENFLRAVERALCSAQAQNDGSVGVRRTGGLFWWLSPTMGGGSDPAPAAVRVAANAFYTGALSALTETVFTGTVLRAMYGQTNKPLVRDVRAGLLLKQTMSNWGVGVNATANQVATRIVTMSELHKKWIGMIDFFQWDVGSVTSWLTQNLACTLDNTGAQPEWIDSAYTPRSGLILNPDQAPRLRYLRPMYSVDQDPGNKKGGGERGFTEMEAMLHMPVPMGQGAIFTNQD
jgi:hypothetical protein